MDDGSEDDGFGVNAYDVDTIAAALRRSGASDKAQTMLTALASAPDRALSRMEMARAVGGSSVNSANSVAGQFCKRLALAIDPELADIKNAGGDYVMFMCHQMWRQTERDETEPDAWVFVLRESLAKAIEQVWRTPFVPLSESVREALFGDGEDDDDENDEDEEEDEDADAAGPFEDPIDDINAVDRLGEFDELEETERDAVVSARIGQGRFRQDVLARWDGRCAVTGIAVEQALVASHIKPWYLASNAERLDPANGLLLVGTLDRLFDSGLITFDEKGSIMLSPRLPNDQRALLHLTPELRLRVVPSDTASYLEYHRAECFWDSEDDDDDAER